MTSSGGPPSCCTQSLTLSLPLWAAALCGLSTKSPAVVSCWTVLLGLHVAGTVGVETSNGISLAIGRLVLSCSWSLLLVLVHPCQSSILRQLLTSMCFSGSHHVLERCPQVSLADYCFQWFYGTPYERSGIHISKLIQQEGLQLGSLGYICHTTISRVIQVLFIHYCVGQWSDVVTMQKVCCCEWFGIFYVWGDVCKRSVIKDGFYLHYQCLQNN